MFPNYSQFSKRTTIKQVVIKVTIWLLAEVALTLIGLDDLADCGEYVFATSEMRPFHPIEIVTPV